MCDSADIDLCSMHLKQNGVKFREISSFGYAFHSPDMRKATESGKLFESVLENGLGHAFPLQMISTSAVAEEKCNLKVRDSCCIF